MKARELLKLGYREGPVIGLALEACRLAKQRGMRSREVRDVMRRLPDDPGAFLDDPVFGPVARELSVPAAPAYAFKADDEARERFDIWGREQIDKQTVDQMVNAVRLPISVGGALMPDAHLGYGLPIGGVLATEDAVIPYAVGVDIACRMMMSVLPLPIKADQP
ncbi:MAG: RtcB family protein, partial [Phycisphaerae bacterium]